jgi:hypothetical protein
VTPVRFLAGGFWARRQREGREGSLRNALFQTIMPRFVAAKRATAVSKGAFAGRQKWPAIALA